MKKFILTAAAAGALAFGGAASAQDLGQVLSNILGLGVPQYNQGGDVGVHGGTPIGNTGWEFAGYDNQGRAIYRNPEGFYTHNAPVAGVYGGNPYSSRSWERDSDGDGVADSRDRWPNDRRYR